MNLSIDRVWYQTVGSTILVLSWDSEKRGCDLLILGPQDRRNLKKVINVLISEMEEEDPEGYLKEYKDILESFFEDEQELQEDDPGDRSNPIVSENRDLSQLSPEELKDLNRKIQNLLRDISAKTKG